MSCSATYKLTAASTLLALMLLLPISYVHASESTPSGDIESIRMLAESGDAAAQNNLGALYATGEGVDQDYSEAANWYRKAAEQGHADAQINLGLLYSYGRGVDQDYSEAAYWFRKVDQNYSYSHPEYWYRREAELGHARDKLRLSDSYFNGDIVERDLLQSEYWLRKAAEQAEQDYDSVSLEYNYNDYVQLELGYRYRDGFRVEQDYSQAVYWFRKAAEQEDFDAQYALATLYANGEGVDQDYSQAEYWFRKAAGKVGHPESDSAQYALATLYYNGDGLTRDVVKASAWYSLAADRKYHDAASKRDSVYSELSLKQSEQALEYLQKLKKRYFPSPYPYQN